MPLHPWTFYPPTLSGEGKRSPWQFYERIFKALETDRSITQQARRYWEMWRHGESGIQPWFENNRVHRLRADLPGYDLQPDQMRASSKEEFLAVMREFHVWAGEPSFREIARNAGKTVGASTLCEALDANKPPRLPTLKVVMAFIHGCGGSEDDLITWTHGLAPGAHSPGYRWHRHPAAGRRTAQRQLMTCKWRVATGRLARGRSVPGYGAITGSARRATPLTPSAPMPLGSV
ncbi:hypothetical protein [Nonomuraea sp. NPDC050786]|uniref:hypothetical protein n=1 Tax=Nonomuraea sp. NPDC050786 TaxID=3154840 RepID=UPI00340AC9E2